MTKPILGGKPLKFETPEELKNVLQEYFDNTDKEEWTVTGLALLIGSRQLLDDYQKREGFEEIVTEAKLIVENGYEIDLKKHGRSGTISCILYGLLYNKVAEEAIETIKKAHSDRVNVSRRIRLSSSTQTEPQQLQIIRLLSK
jgi:hypothetical protein